MDSDHEKSADDDHDHHDHHDEQGHNHHDAVDGHDHHDEQGHNPHDDVDGHDHHDDVDGHDHHDDVDERDHGHNDHDHHHHDIEELGIAVLTITSTRGIDDDAAGNTIGEIVESAGHTVSVRELINDDFDSIQSTVDRLANRADTDCVVATGGTGVTPDDVTVEAAKPLFDKHLPGFGELFRHFSREDIGTKVVGTRATAGIVDGVPVFCLPGSENAARLGTEAIIVEVAPHLAGLARRDDGTGEDETEK